MALTFEQVEQYGKQVSGNVIRLGFTLYWSQGDGRSGCVHDTGEYGNPDLGITGFSWRVDVAKRELVSNGQVACFNDRMRTLGPANARYRQLFDGHPSNLDHQLIVIRPRTGVGKIQMSLTSLRWTNTLQVIDLARHAGTGLYTGIGQPIGQSADKALYALSFHSVEWYAN